MTFKTKSFLPLLLFLCLGVTGFGQAIPTPNSNSTILSVPMDNGEKIEQFVFSRHERKSYIEITIYSDVIFIDKGDYPQSSGNVSKRKTDKKEWEALINSIAQYQLTDLQNLPPPTNNYLIEGVGGSTIVIKTNKHEYFCGSFDKYNPNEKLAKLLNVIREIGDIK